jgi:2-polyprenyl-6-methoxyphenol hydroxylase-like FAD-dependent oxidoreductase
MAQPLVLIAGGGFGGLATALTLHQIGVPCLVFESVREMKPLGVGINLQPNAMRELYDLGITEAELDEVGVPANEWALVGLNGNDVYSETRGRLAGYRWPQYAVHRGQLQLLLYRTVLASTRCSPCMDNSPYRWRRSCRRSNGRCATRRRSAGAPPRLNSSSPGVPFTTTGRCRRRRIDA